FTYRYESVAWGVAVWGYGEGRRAKPRPLQAQCGQERAAHLAGPDQARLNRLREPGGIAGEEVRVEVHQRAVAGGDLGDGRVQARMIGAGQARVHAEEVVGVAAEVRVVDGAQEDRAHRQG